MGALEDWGWDEAWRQALRAAAPGLLPARVVEEQRGAYRLAAEPGERPGRLPGALRHRSETAADLPAVGDWVAVEPGPGGGPLLIRGLLPRRSKLSRRAAGEASQEQVLAANLDAVLVVTAFNQDFNPRRLERYLAAAAQSGAEAVLVLNKLDACADPAPFLEQARALLPEDRVAALSALSGEGLPALSRWLRPGRTAGFVGSSGVGKSTLINLLLGEERIRTAGTRPSDERGRHTTTHRRMHLLPAGGILLDTPGLRELQLWEAEEGIADAFEDLEALAAGCRFRDCAHEGEPGCAVAAAAGSGGLPPARLESWRKLRRELAREERRKDPAAQAEERRRLRAIHKAMRDLPKKRPE